LHQANDAPAGLQQQQRQAIFAELWVSFKLDAYTGNLSRHLDCQWRQPFPVQQHIHLRLMHAAVDGGLSDCAAKTSVNQHEATALQRHGALTG